MSNLDIHALRDACSLHPEFEGGTAYIRTKICCRVLIEHGEAIPSWMVIREIIEKGSPADISRGVKAFRGEHAETLRQMSGVVPGLPDNLAAHIRGFWEAAVATARGEFAASVIEWENQIAQATAIADQAEIKRLEAIAVADRLQSMIAALENERTGLQSQLEHERAARLQAERMFQTHTAEVNAQRDRLEASLNATKEEMAKALERFDGERRYAMTQVEEARIKATTEISAIRVQSQREKAALELNITRLDSLVAELRKKSAADDQRCAVAEQETSDLRERLHRAETLADKLAGDNRRLISALKNKPTKVGNAPTRKIKQLRSAR